MGYSGNDSPTISSYRVYIFGFERERERQKEKQRRILEFCEVDKIRKSVLSFFLTTCKARREFEFFF